MYSKLNTMNYKVVSSNSPSGLSDKVNKQIEEGWRIIGSHLVSLSHSQNRFSGSMHKDTIHEIEYSQTMVFHKPTAPIEISVDAMYIYTDEELSVRGYDIEGMRIEFERKLENLIKED